MKWFDQFIKTNPELALNITVVLFALAMFMGFVVPQVYSP
jgi:hypothetical protein